MKDKSRIRTKFISRKELKQKANTRQKELRGSILKLLEDRHCLTETELYKELLENDGMDDRTCISKVATDLAYEGKIIWMPGDFVGILSLPRMLH